MRIAVRIFLALALAVTVIVLFAGSGTAPEAGMVYIKNAAEETGALNAVTAIYLNYRMYDSIFETLMLLVSASAVIHFSWRKDHE